ncbi:MAG: cysteine desulfurase family protein [Bacillota bacterium]
MTEIYLDNSATTRPYQAVVDLTSRIQAESYGNPSSMHGKGIEAEKIISTARRQVAAVFKCHEKEVYFTSGGTEANNLAIKGAAYRNRRRGTHLVTSNIEHPSVLKCFQFLEQEGFTVSYLQCNCEGLIKPEQLEKVIGRETILVSIMHVNNEIGSIQPLSELGCIIKNNNLKTIFHVDTVQSFGRLPLELDSWQADLVTASAHKIHGPGGAGCLFVKKDTLLQPLLHGGSQENGLRSGTENTSAIAGFGLAADICSANLEQKSAELYNLKLSFYHNLLETGASFAVNGPAPENSVPHIINISFPGLKAEVLLHSLEDKGIFVSAGSACHSKHPEPSYVLKAIEANSKYINSALRFSFSSFNTMEEAKTAAIITAKVTAELRKYFNGSA